MNGYNSLAEQHPLQQHQQHAHGSVGDGGGGSSGRTNRARWGPRLIALGSVIAAVMVTLPALMGMGHTRSAKQQTKLAKKKPPVETICTSPNFKHKTLKLAFESPIVSMFMHLKSDMVHELSDVLFLGDKFYAVCDSSWNLFEVDRSLPRFSHKNRILEPAKVPFPDEEESSYEAIFFDNGVMYLVRESLALSTHGGGEEYHAVVVEAELIQPGDADATGFGNGDGDDVGGDGGGDGGGENEAEEQLGYRVLRSCPVEEPFEGDSKGFEGAIHLHDSAGNIYMLALCEGNHCAQKERGRDKGNGILVVTEKVVKKDGSCSWQTVRRLKVPASAYFQDYSGINVDLKTGNVLISSQEESQLWIGKLSLADDGTFDPKKSEFLGGVVFDFPRNDNCDVFYCNLEGVTWVTDSLIVAVSDRMKGGGRQPSRCAQKDQSIHVFSLPETWQTTLQEELDRIGEDSE